MVKNSSPCCTRDVVWATLGPLATRRPSDNNNNNKHDNNNNSNINNHDKINNNNNSNKAVQRQGGRPTTRSRSRGSARFSLRVAAVLSVLGAAVGACSGALCGGVLRGSRSSKVVLRAAGPGSPTEGSQGGQLWLDLRPLSNVAEVASRMQGGPAALAEYASGAPALTEASLLNSLLLELFNGVKQKLQSMRQSMPQGQGVDAVLVDRIAAVEVQKQAAPLGMPVFSFIPGSPDESLRSLEGDSIVGSIQDSTGEVVGGLSLPPNAPWLTGPSRQVKKVWRPGSFGVGLSVAGRSQEELEVAGLLATTLPKDVMLWSAALMKRARKSAERASGSG
ncbi:unnamed protein product [Polarella glacialis]|uniref:Uncharacterized protein n=1 Tax=Polarella glacialis TaxID=89957 RepID=A0A813KYD5_POLGL|nr:unnamed protein product [Polarella glacialis]